MVSHKQVWVLKRYQLPRRLRPEDFARLDPGSEGIDFPRHRVATAPGRHLFGVEEGRVCISRFETDGTETVVAIVEEGELFELADAGFSPSPPAMVEALEASRLRPLDPRRVDRSLEHDLPLQRKLEAVDMQALHARGGWR